MQNLRRDTPKVRQRSFFPQPRSHEEMRSHFQSHGAGHVFELIERLRLTRLLLRYPARLVWAAVRTDHLLFQHCDHIGAGRSHRQSLCVPFPGTNSVLAFLYTSCPRIESPACIAWTRNRPGMRIHRAVSDWHNCRCGRIAARRSLADGSSSGVFLERDRSIYGFVSSQPSSGRRDNAHRVTWIVVNTNRVADD